MTLLKLKKCLVCILVSKMADRALLLYMLYKAHRYCIGNKKIILEGVDFHICNANIRLVSFTFTYKKSLSMY